MADDDKEKASEEAKNTLKALLNEVLDEREVKAKDAREQEEKEKEESESKRTSEKPAFLSTLLGF